MTNDPAVSANRLVAVCDACVLYSITMADWLTSLGEAGLYHPKWTRDIHEAWIRNVIDKLGSKGSVTRDNSLSTQSCKEITIGEDNHCDHGRLRSCCGAFVPYASTDKRAAGRRL